MITAIPFRLLGQLHYWAGRIGSQRWVFICRPPVEQCADLDQLFTLGLIHRPDWTATMVVVQLTNAGRAALRGDTDDN